VSAVDAGARPRPDPTALTRPLWDAAREHRLVRQVCDDCGRNVFTPQIACPACLSTALSWRESSGRGTVYSATVVHRAPYPGFTSPYHVAMVDLEEGWTMLSNVLGTGEHPVAIDTPVAVDWLQLDDEITLPVFRPADAEGAR
jgi:uncharacterized OB-fold protein